MGEQVVLISGEAGLGKSRIAAALAECLHAEPHLRLRYFCSPYHLDSALFPCIDQLGRAAGFARDDPPAARLEKLEALLALVAPPDEDVALLADLMSVPASERQLPKQDSVKQLLHAPPRGDIAQKHPASRFIFTTDHRGEWNRIMTERIEGGEHGDTGDMDQHPMGLK